MPSIGHIAVGMAAARWYPGRSRSLPLRMAALSAVSILPDADIMAFALGIPYGHPFGHRGASHSLCVAAALGLMVFVAARLMGRKVGRASLLVAAVMASHGLLDTLTDGGRGIALLWPWSAERYFAPWRPLPVAPIWWGYFSARGLEVALTELVWFAPLWAYALWPRRQKLSSSDGVLG